MNLEQFAGKYPIGTKVRYYPVAGELYFDRTAIRSEPWALGHGDIVVKIEGRTGGVSIDHIQIDNGRPCTPPPPPVKPVS